MEIIFSKQAVKFLEKQNKITRLRILKAIQRLPSYGDVKRLSGEDVYRLRVGNFRIIYDHYGNIVEIIKIDNRGQVYK